MTNDFCIALHALVLPDHKAGALAAKGESTAIIEKSDKIYGRPCINVACIPTKSLEHSARLSAVQGGSFKEKSERHQKAVEKNADFPQCVEEKITIKR